MMFVGVCEGRDGNAPWRPYAILGGLGIIIPAIVLAFGTAAACVVNDVAWGDHTYPKDPSFGKKG